MKSKKVNHWNYIRSLVKKDFDRKGIRFCEICGSTMYLGFAHRLKRRFITTDEELKTVALLCQTHHDALEYGPKETMFAEITRIIENRI